MIDKEKENSVDNADGGFHGNGRYHSFQYDNNYVCGIVPYDCGVYGNIY